MNKDEKLQITKDKLIEATFRLMEEAANPLEVTSRQIAARADVMPAMINYCFGSRENLIYQAFQTQYLSFMEETDIQAILQKNLAPKDLLKEMHFYVSKCLVQQYKFTQAITGFVLFKRDLGKESFSFKYVKAHYQGRKSDAECSLIAYELSTMMQLIIFRKEDIKRDFGIDLEDEETLRHYIGMRVDLLLGGD